MLQRVRVEKTVPSRSPETAFAFVVDVENYPRLMPNVRQVQILEQTGTHRITHWDTEIEQAPLVWTEEDLIIPAELRVRFHSIEGDFEVFRGCWEVVGPDPAGRIQVACELEYSVGIPVIEEVVGPVLRQKIIENLEIMLNGLARAAAEP